MSKGPRTRRVMAMSLPDDVIDAANAAVREGRATSRSDAFTRLARDGMAADGLRRGHAPSPSSPSAEKPKE